MNELVIESVKQALSETALDLAEEKANRAMYKRACELLEEENRQLKEKLAELEVQDVPDSKQATNVRSGKN
ncbi:hypothetical protein [Abiotrophia defectiva]|uniref:hypothetical protein n=1 Tax=Abiotrophia defectiva TaxID=46125 RepID=UPI0028D8F79E|nr:hypothetical protein [Abiotrophia defectiva]